MSALQYFHLQNKTQNGSGSWRQRPREPMGAQHPWGAQLGGWGLLWGTGASRSMSAGCVRESLVLASKPVKRDSLSWDKKW